MKSSRNMTIAFLLNFSFAIIEFIFGLLFHSSAVLADAIHDTGDALAIGLSTFFEKISTRKEDREYTLGYKRYSLLGALLTSVILLIGSTLVIVENVPKLFAPEKVNYDGMLVLGIVAIAVNTAASRVVSHGHSHNESILSLHFLEDILGWLAVVGVSIILRFTDWYFLDPLLSLGHRRLYSQQGSAKILGEYPDFPRPCAQRCGSQSALSGNSSAGKRASHYPAQCLDDGWFRKIFHASYLSGKSKFAG